MVLLPSISCIGNAAISSRKSRARAAPLVTSSGLNTLFRFDPTSSFESSEKVGVVEKSSNSAALLFARATTASGKLANSAT